MPSDSLSDIYAGLGSAAVCDPNQKRMLWKVQQRQTHIPSTKFWPAASFPKQRVAVRCMAGPRISSLVAQASAHNLQIASPRDHPMAMRGG
jgi:hypothetical protein